MWLTCVYLQADAGEGLRLAPRCVHQGDSPCGGLLLQRFLYTPPLLVGERVASALLLFLRSCSNADRRAGRVLQAAAGAEGVWRRTSDGGALQALVGVTPAGIIHGSVLHP